MKAVRLIIAIFWLPSATLAGSAHASFPGEAQRHFDRGTAAVEMAASLQDFEAAAQEFREAARLAPAWPEAHYNLALILEKLDDLDGAISGFRRYLELAPLAADTGVVTGRINKLEYRREREAERARLPLLLEGTWKGPMAFCGGHRSELRFYDWGQGEVSVELPINWNANPGMATDLQRLPVEIEGRTVRFSFRSKMVVPGITTSHCEVRYELELLAPGRLKGSIIQDGAPGREISLQKP